MLAHRLLTAVIGIPIILGVIYVGGWPMAVVLALVLAVASIELIHMIQRDSRPVWQLSPAAIVAAAGVAAVAIGAEHPFKYWEPYDALILGVGAAFLFATVFGKSDASVNEWAAIVAALMYLGYLGSFFVILRHVNEFPFPVSGDLGVAIGRDLRWDNGEWLYWAVLSTWGTDTCAYSIGKLIGRHKMAPRISPGKTWEGTAGGLVGGLIVVVALSWALELPVSTGQAVLLGLMLPAVAVLADLGESVIKRSAGVKDTSVLVPGHGGFLDRLDSLLFTVPLVYYFAVWVVL